MVLTEQLKNVISLIRKNKQTIIINTEDDNIKKAVSVLLKKNFQKSNIVFYPAEENSIKTEKIRNITKNLSTKRLNKHFIIIDNSEKMTLGAQNAFLKVLEEPIDQVYFILFTNNPKILLDTVISRASVINFNNQITDFEKIIKNKNKDISDQEIAKLKFISNNNLSIAKKMLEDKDFCQDYESLAFDAKKLVNSSNKEKILIIHNYFDDREKAIKLLKITIRIYQTALIKNNSNAIRQKIDIGLKTINLLKQNVSIKLALINFVL